MLIADQPVEKTDLIFIRHAESENNKAISEFVTKNNITYSWQEVSKSQEFLSDIKYNEELIDCSISEEGKEQCRQARIYTNTLKPDVIIVSPLERALETCQRLFGKRDIPVFVEPILSEGLRSACDVSKGIKETMQNYPKYIFSKTVQQDDLWFVDHQQPEMKQPIYEKLNESKEQLTQQEKAVKILEVMRDIQLYQLPTSIRKRSKKIKQLLKKYKQKYQTICVVAHYNTINYSVSKTFKENDQPADSPCLSNCQVYHASLDEICKYE